MFLFRKKKIHIDAFTDAPGVFHFASIERASKFVPQWWKDLPPTYTQTNANGIDLEHATMRYCPGIRELYKTGFVIPLWSDLLIEVTDKDLKYQFSADITSSHIIGNNAISFQNPQQIQNSFNSYIPLKIRVPWLIREKTGVNFYIGDPLWNKKDYANQLRVLPGILNFKYQTSIHSNVFVSKNSRRLEIPARDPLMHIIPLSDKDISIKCHLVDSSEMQKLYPSSSYGLSFRNTYYKIRQLSGDRCPFENFEKTRDKDI